MRCLVCHKKVSRFRYWKTKSEFCSEEHADQYKRQTLDRLLRDQESLIRKANAPPLPIIDDDDLETAAAAEHGFESVIDRSHMLPAAADESAFDSEVLTEQPSAPAADPWERESAPASASGGAVSTDDVLTQSPKQALEALQQLAQSSQSSPAQDLGEGAAENRAQPSGAGEGEAASVFARKSEADSMMDRLMEATESSESKGRQSLWLEEKEFAEHLAATGDTLLGEVLVTPPPSWLLQTENDTDLPAAETETPPEEAAQQEQEWLAESTKSEAEPSELPQPEDRLEVAEQPDEVGAKNTTAAKSIPARLLSEQLKSFDFELAAAGMDLEESADSAEDPLIEAPPREEGGELRAVESLLSEPGPADGEEDELSELLAEPAEEQPAASAPTEQPEKDEKVVPFPAPGEREEAASAAAPALEAWLDLEPLEPVANEAVAEETVEPDLPRFDENGVLRSLPELRLGTPAIAPQATFRMISGDAPRLETALDPPVPQEIDWSPPLEENTADLISGGIAAELYSEGAPLPDERAVRATASPTSLFMPVDLAPFEGASDEGIERQADVDMPGLEIRSSGEAPSSGPLKAAVWKRALDPCSGLLPLAPALQLAPQHPVAEIHGDAVRSKVECRLPVSSGPGYRLSVQCRLVPEVRLRRSSWPALVEVVNEQVVSAPEIPDGASQSIPPPLALQLPEGAYRAIVGGRATFPKVDQLLLAFALADQRRVWQSSAPFSVSGGGPGRPDEWVEELHQAPADWRAEPIGPLLAVQGPANLDPCEYT